VPSKTFHFGPGFDQVVQDLFESYMRLAALIQASTLILPEAGEDFADVTLAIARMDRKWVQLWRYYWVSPPDPD
jgi:hypothetical protein